MKFKSRWSRGLTYGGAWGGVMLIFPIFHACVERMPLRELVFIGVSAFISYGIAGVVVGFSCHGQDPSNVLGPASSQGYSVVQRVLYRIVAGFLLSYVAAAILSTLAVTLRFAVFYGALLVLGRHYWLESTHCHRLMFAGTCGFLGAEGGAFAACWLGSILAPGGNPKPAFLSAAIGAFSGSWFAIIPILRHSQDWRDEPRLMILAACGGALAGIGSAAAFGLRAAYLTRSR